MGAQKIWTEYENVFNVILTDVNVLLGKDIDDESNLIISILCHLIYREWLDCSLENKTRKHILGLKVFKYDLLFYCNVYKQLGIKWLSTVIKINQLNDFINTMQ